MASTIPTYPASLGEFRSAEGSLYEFVVHHRIYHMTAGEVGVPSVPARTLRERLPEPNSVDGVVNAPALVRSLSPIEEMAYLLPALAADVRSKCRSPATAHTWEEFHPQNVTVRINRRDPGGQHIEVTYRVAAGLDVVIVRQLDPVQ